VGHKLPKFFFFRQVSSRSLYLIILAFSGCINEKEETAIIEPSENADPIPIISTIGTISPKPDINESTIDAYVYGEDEVTFDASGSYDPDGNITSFQWLLDEDNTNKSGPLVTHTYYFDDSIDFPNIVEIILSVEDNNGSIVYLTFYLGIIPKEYTFYLDAQLLTKYKPDSSSEKVKATFDLFRPTQTLSYSLNRPVHLEKCEWNITIFLEKPLLSFVNKVTFKLNDENGDKIVEVNITMKLLEFWKEKTITISGTISEPKEFKSLEITIYGFSLRNQIAIMYGGEKASLLNFDFTA
jgi:hypothetical protein